MGENIFGKDVGMKFYQNNAPVVMKLQSARVEEQGDVVLDQICGDDRAEPQAIIDGYLITLQAYVDNSLLLDSILANRANEDAQAVQLIKAFGFRLQFHDTTKKVYIAKELTYYPFTLDIPSRKDRIQLPLKLFARRFTAASAAV